MCLTVTINGLGATVRVFRDCDHRTVKSERFHLFHVGFDLRVTSGYLNYHNGETTSQPRELGCRPRLGRKVDHQTHT